MSEQVIIRPEILDDSYSVGASFEILKADFEQLYGAGTLPDNLYINAEIEGGTIIEKIIDFKGTEKDAVQIKTWDELARLYSDDSIEKYGFRVSWVREIHTPLPWVIEKEIRKDYL